MPEKGFQNLWKLPPYFLNYYLFNWVLWVIFIVFVSFQIHSIFEKYSDLFALYQLGSEKRFAMTVFYGVGITVTSAFMMGLLLVLHRIYDSCVFHLPRLKRSKSPGVARKVQNRKYPTHPKADARVPLK